MSTQLTDALARKLDRLPRRPGVYLFKDARKEIIYVGKAKDLRARVRSYWLEGAEDRRLITARVAQVADLDVVVTASEKEALLLECNFIKQFRPKYNVIFRDDKSFVSIKLDPGEPWPRPVITRRLEAPNALYFGPYASAKAARKTVRVVQDTFPLRKCSLRQCRRRQRPCLYGEMGRCAAPCCGGISEGEYGRLIDQVVMFLRGKGDELLADLRRQMQEAAEAREFEKAACVRDRIRAVETTLEAQHVSSTAERVDRDIFGLCTLDEHVSVAVLFVRDGGVRDAATYRFPAALDSEEAIFGAFLTQFYTQTRFIPAEVLVPVPVDDAELIESWLSEKKGRRVRLHHPRRGTKRRLIELADHNARAAERGATTREQERRSELESLRELLGLKELPADIECFDISTTQGREAVGSMVAFRGGEPDKSSYRRYRIRRVEGQDDLAMMREVLTRRYRKADRPPDLVVVDGGRGQLGVAVAVLRELGMGGCDAAALAKARSAGGRKVKAERVYLPGKSAPIELPERSAGYRLITRLRDEAHRFAVDYHRRLRRKAALASPLLAIAGVGPKTARRLLRHFGRLDAVRRATTEELRQVKGISARTARAIRDHYGRAADGSGGVEGE